MFAGGNSGGAAIDDKGHLVGVPTRIGDIEKRGQYQIGQVNYLRPIANEIRTTDLPRGKVNEQYKQPLRVLRASDKKSHSVYDQLSSHRAAVSLLVPAGDWRRAPSGRWRSRVRFGDRPWGDAPGGGARAGCARRIA